VSSKGEKKEGGNHGKRNEKRRKGENGNERKNDNMQIREENSFSPPTFYF
jgi:hypothetical protein